MTSPRVCWIVVVCPDIVRVGHTNWQAPEVGDPSVCLPMEVLWNFCDALTEPTQQSLLPLHREGYPDALAQGVSTQTDRRGLLPSWAKPTPCVQMSAWGVRCGWTAKWKLRGWYRGVAAKWEWLRVHSAQMGGWKVYLLNRCFRGVCLSWGCDMVSEGQSGDHREDICCWACCSSVATQPKKFKDESKVLTFGSELCLPLMVRVFSLAPLFITNIPYSVVIRWHETCVL